MNQETEKTTTTVSETITGEELLRRWPMCSDAQRSIANEAIATDAVIQATIQSTPFGNYLNQVQLIQPAPKETPETIRLAELAKGIVYAKETLRCAVEVAKSKIEDAEKRNLFGHLGHNLASAAIEIAEAAKQLEFLEAEQFYLNGKLLSR